MLSQYDNIPERGTPIMKVGTLFSSPKFTSLFLYGATQPPRVLGSPPTFLQTAVMLTIFRTYLPLSLVALRLFL